MDYQQREILFVNIRGIHKSSLIDFPGKISAVLFSGGCNLRCRYCHNPVLVSNDSTLPRIPDDEIIAFLDKRKNLLDGVVLTGGEPTLEKDLSAFISGIKELSLAVKLDTNGLRPEVLKELLLNEMPDYVAVDIKTSPSRYKDLTGVDVSFSDIVRTVDILRNSGVDYELRTTCVPGYVTDDDFADIKNEIGKVKRYCLQQFVSDSRLLDENFQKINPYPVKILEKMREFILTFSDECFLRGI